MARPRSDSSTLPTRARVLEAARDAFASSGHAGARLADIARVVGIRRPSLLHHFPTKDALYREVVGSAFAELGGALAGPLQAGGPYGERLETLAREFGAFVESRPAVARIVLHELLGEDGPGQQILLEQVVPLLNGVAAFVEAHGAKRLAHGVSARAALMTVVSDTLLRTAAGPLRTPLWGPSLADLSWAVTRALMWTEAP